MSHHPGRFMSSLRSSLGAEVHRGFDLVGEALHWSEEHLLPDLLPIHKIMDDTRSVLRAVDTKFCLAEPDSTRPEITPLGFFGMIGLASVTPLVVGVGSFLVLPAVTTGLAVGAIPHGLSQVSRWIDSSCSSEKSDEPRRLQSVTCDYYRQTQWQETSFYNYEPYISWSATAVYSCPPLRCDPWLYGPLLLSPFFVGMMNGLGFIPFLFLHHTFPISLAETLFSSETSAKEIYREAKESAEEVLEGVMDQVTFVHHKIEEVVDVAAHEIKKTTSYVGTVIGEAVSSLRDAI